MKKNVFILIALLIFCLSQVFAAECGDVNKDGKVDIVDALLIAKDYVGSHSLSKSVADTNNDNNVNIVDALLVAQLYVGIINQLNCPGIVTDSPPPTPTKKPNTTPNNGSSIITINDKAPGWASMSGGTTGGGTDMSIAKTVSSLSSAVKGSNKKIILLKPGTYSGSFSVGANTTIIGTAPGVTIKGHITISGSGSKNIIIRNIAIRDNRCSSFGACRSGSDAVYIGNGAHHVWFDHCDIADGQDGNFDVTKAGDFITVSWTKFHYTYNKGHKFSNLIAGSDGETGSRGKLNITYMYCWWGERVEQRQPRGRFGKIHVFNCYYNSQESGGDPYLLGPGKEMAMIIENNYFDVPSNREIIREWGASKGWLATGNEGNASNSAMNSKKGSVFNIGYDYNLMPASQVKAVVSAPVGGAGNTVTFKK